MSKTFWKKRKLLILLYLNMKGLLRTTSLLCKFRRFGTDTILGESTTYGPNPEKHWNFLKAI